MANKLIFKVEFNKQTKTEIKIDTEVDSCKVDFKERFGEVVGWAIGMSCYDRRLFFN